jgi:hypothetical protein
MKSGTVTAAARKRGRQVVSTGDSVKEVVREVRQVSRRIGKDCREVERLLKRVRVLRTACAERPGRRRALEAALPHMEETLQRALLPIEEGWVDLDTSFSGRDLSEEVASARERSRPAGRTPGSSQSLRRRKPGKTGGRGR